MCSVTEAPAVEQAQYPNLASLGLGYNMARGDPFAEVDKGFATSIFSPVSLAEQGGGHHACKLVGYHITEGEACGAATSTEVFKSTLSVAREMSKMASELNSYELPTITVTDSADRGRTGAVSRESTGQRGTSRGTTVGTSSGISAVWSSERGRTVGSGRHGEATVGGSEARETSRSRTVGVSVR